jgi:hypothetical protein
VHEETGAVTCESFFLFLNSGVCTELLADTSTEVHCQPSVYICNQEHGIGNCVVCWAIFTYLDIAGKH